MTRAFYDMSKNFYTNFHVTLFNMYEKSLYVQRLIKLGDPYKSSSNKINDFYFSEFTKLFNTKMKMS